MPHVNAIKRAIERGEPAPSIGDRIAFYVIEGKSKNISDRTELEEYVLKNNLSIDKSYYVDRQLTPPIDRIFDAMEFNRILMNKNSRQKTLFEL
jgi:DNA polymerase I